VTIKVTIKKGKPLIARPEDAFVFLDDALRAPAKSKLRQTLLDGALMASYFGLLNQHKFSVRGDRRGRPKGTTGAVHRRHSDDADAVELMARIHADTAESRPHALARMVVEKGFVSPTPTATQAIKRLAGRYKLHTPK